MNYSSGVRAGVRCGVRKRETQSEGGVFPIMVGGGFPTPSPMLLSLRYFLRYSGQTVPNQRCGEGRERPPPFCR